MKTLFFISVFLCSIFPITGNPHRSAAIDSLTSSLADLRQAYGQYEQNELRLLQKRFLYDSLIARANAEKDTLVLIQAYIGKGDTEYFRNMYTSAYALYDSAIALTQALSETDEHTRWDRLTSLYLRQGETSYFIGKYVSGVEYLYRLLRQESSLDPAVRMQGYLWLGKLFVRLKKNNLAIEYLQKAESVRNELASLDSLPTSSFPFRYYSDLLASEKPPAPGIPEIPKKFPVRPLLDHLSFELNISYSSAFLQKGDYRTSLSCIEEARKTARTEELARVFQNLSLHYFHVSDMEKALDYCIKAYKHSDNIYEKSVIANNYAVLLFEQKQYDSALTICLRNLKSITRTDVYHVRSNLYFILSRIYEARGMYKDALSYRRKEQEVLDSVYDKESEEKILQLNNAFATDNILRDRKILEYQLKLREVEDSRKNILLALFILLSLAALGLILIIIKHLHQKKKENLHLKEEIVHINEDNRKFIQSSQAEFESELTNKTCKLTANTMYIAQMCDTSKQILSEVHKLAPFCSQKGERILLNIQKLAASLSVEDRGWNDFKLYFEQIHPSFFTSLNSACPKLTAGENRLCAFIVMNLTAKEISALTNRSIRTVETAKFRLRKKLDIPKEMNLYSFLWQFTGSPAEQNRQ